MATESALRDEIVRVCRRLWERGLIAGPDGNVSVRLGPDRLLVTPSGLSKVDVGPEDLVVVDARGKQVAGERSASSELAVHLYLYAHRPDVQAVVHAHPPTATGFALAGEDFMAPVLPEVILQMGGVPLVPYRTPGTRELAEAFAPHVADCDAFLMANHGATTVGPTLHVAHQRMESLEHSARILLAARMLGRVNRLTAEQVAELVAGQSASRARRTTSGDEPAAGRETE
jgi:L-fuculose-phosphate aldolase